MEKTEEQKDIPTKAPLEKDPSILEINVSDTVNSESVGPGQL